jgi:D-alanine--poly(phosphoribitol) ligase subunit 2
MPTETLESIHGKVIELALEIGQDAARLSPDTPIPGSGLLDSAGLLQLMVWVESEYGLSIPEEDLNVENFGTMRAIADYIGRARA